MSHARTPRALVVSALLAAVLALTGTAPAVAADPAVTGTIDPTTLATGEAPDIPWLEGWSLHQPSRPTVSVEPYAGLALLHARDGYVLRTDTGTVFVGPTGKRRYLDRSTRLQPVVASATGAWVVLQEYYTGRLRVLRTSDGHRVGGRVLPSGWRARVIGAGDGQVLLSLFGYDSKTRKSRQRTVLWDPVRNTTRTVVGRASTAVSFGARRVAVTAGRRQLVLDLRTGKVLWSTPTGTKRLYEEAVLFSPDDKRVLTVGPATYDLGQGGERTVREALRIRDARTGRLLTTLRGYIDVDTSGDPAELHAVWESSTRLLLTAGTKPVQDVEGEFVLPNRAVVRCSTTSAHCVKVRGVEPYQTRVMVRRSN